MKYEDFICELWDAVRACPREWRKGQSVFNVIEEMWGVARAVQWEDGVDCFYNDDCIQEFIDKSWERIKEVYGY